MSEQPDIDARIAALLADPQPARPDSAFADRIVALAAYDLSTRNSRRRALIQVGREALGLAATPRREQFGAVECLLTATISWKRMSVRGQ